VDDPPLSIENLPLSPVVSVGSSLPLVSPLSSVLLSSVGSVVSVVVWDVESVSFLLRPMMYNVCPAE